MKQQGPGIFKGDPVNYLPQLVLATKKLKPHTVLPEKTKNAFLEEFERQFAEQWNEKIKGLYLGLMTAMGSDFRPAENIDKTYKQRIVELSDFITPKRTTQRDNKKFVVFEINDGKGQILANQNSIVYEGTEFNNKIADAMTTIAAHDIDNFLENGFEITGKDLYQKSLLQLFIAEKYGAENITNFLSQEDLDPRALKEFEDHQAQIKKENPAPENTDLEEPDTSQFVTATFAPASYFGVQGYVEQTIKPLTPKPLLLTPDQNALAIANDRAAESAAENTALRKKLQETDQQLAEQSHLAEREALVSERVYAQLVKTNEELNAAGKIIQQQQESLEQEKLNASTLTQNLEQKGAELESTRMELGDLQESFIGENKKIEGLIREGEARINIIENLNTDLNAETERADIAEARANDAEQRIAQTEEALTREKSITASAQKIALEAKQVQRPEKEAVLKFVDESIRNTDQLLKRLEKFCSKSETQPSSDKPNWKIGSALAKAAQDGKPRTQTEEPVEKIEIPSFMRPGAPPAKIMQGPNGGKSPS